jgi:hypothetical protein
MRVLTFALVATEAIGRILKNTERQTERQTERKTERKKALEIYPPVYPAKTERENGRFNFLRKNIVQSNGALQGGNSKDLS